MMEKTMDFMTQKFSPKVNKVIQNPWVSAIQDSIMSGFCWFVSDSRFANRWFYQGTP